MEEKKLIQYTLIIDGMKCGMCESHVNDVVRRVKGVKKVTSSHLKGNTVVIMEESTSKEEIKNVIEKEGYHVLNEEENPMRKKDSSPFSKNRGDVYSSRRL